MKKNLKQNKMTIVSTTSKKSYKQLVTSGTIGNKQKKVYKTIKSLGKATNRMIANDLGWDINRITGRVNELVNFGLVVSTGTYKDRETNRTVTLWECK
jgi:predicted HTH transcriptional regulator